MEAAELVELEEKLAAAEERLLKVLRRDRDPDHSSDLVLPLPRRTVRCSLVLGQGEGWEEEGKEEEKEEAGVEDSPVSAPLLFVMSLTILSWLVSTAPCIWQSLVLCCFCLRCTVRGLLWEITSGGIPYSALLV